MTTALEMNTRPNSVPPYAYAAHLDTVLARGSGKARQSNLAWGAVRGALATVLALLAAIIFS